MHFVITDRDLAAVGDQFLNAVSRCAELHSQSGFTPALLETGDLVCALHKKLISEIGLNGRKCLAIDGDGKKISYAIPEPNDIILLPREFCTPDTKRVIQLTVKAYKRLCEKAKNAGINIVARSTNRL